jgi:hypothetical protein
LGPIRLNTVYGLDFNLRLDIRIRILKIKLKQCKGGDLYKMWFLGVFEVGLMVVGSSDYF